MNKLLAILLSSLFATASFAAAHTGAPMPEAQKAGSPKAEAAAQAKAEEKKAKKVKKVKKSTDEQQAKDAKKLQAFFGPNRGAETVPSGLGSGGHTFFTAAFQVKRLS